jgi:hypothetical protein
MSRTTRRILKAAEVVLSDPLRLSIDSALAAPCAGPYAASSTPTVRLVQSHPEYALIEITCPCGRSTQVRCDYAAANPPAAVTEKQK